MNHAGESPGTIAAAPTVQHAVIGDDGAVRLPDASFIAGAEYSRAGPDLEILSGDGASLLVPEYFSTPLAAPLIGPNNLMLDGSTVNLLAGPQFPGQYAQAGGATQTASPIGKVEKLEGGAIAQRADGTEHTLKVGDPVFQSDVITTGDAGVVGLKFTDGTVLLLQQSGKLVLNEFVFSPGGSENKALLNIVEGTFSLFAGSVAPSGDMMIKTPIATMGIRGTSLLGIDVDALLGRLSLTQDPDGKVGFVEIFNNLNGNLFTVLRTVFNKITLTENGLLQVSPKSPEELALDQSLTDTLHQYYETVPKAGPDETKPRPQTGSPAFGEPGLQDINLDPDNGPELPEEEQLLLSPEELEELLFQLLQNPLFQDAIIQELQGPAETPPVAGNLTLVGLDEAANVGEGSQVDTVLPFNFGPSGPGNVGFASLDGQPLVDSNGNPVTSGGEPLVYVWDAENNVLTAVIQGEDGDIPVFAIQVDPVTGEVTVTIIGAVDHLGANSDTLSVGLDFTVTAGNGESVEGTLVLNINDDVPVAMNDVAVVNIEEDQTVNFAFVIDRSGSMSSNPGAEGFTTRLELAVEALRQLLAAGNVNQVMVVAFSSASTVSGWSDPATALTFIEGLIASGGTNYEGAINTLMQNWGEGPTAADQTLVYFLSDGAPGSQSGIDSEQQTLLEQFFGNNNVDESFAVAIGNNVPGAELEPIAWQPGNPESDPLFVTDEAALIQTLTNTLGPVQNVLANDEFGGDGPGGIQSITIDGFTYVFDGESITVLDSNGQPVELDSEISMAPPGLRIGGAMFSVETLQGGLFSFSFADGEEGVSAGDWNYKPFNDDYDDYYEVESLYSQVYAIDQPPNFFGDQLPYENFRYSIVDGDGDVTTGNLTLVLDPESVDNVIQGSPEGERIEGATLETDVLVGGAGPDTFTLNSTDVFDYIADYEFDEGDLIDLSALLDGVTADNVSDYVRVENYGAGAVDALQVDPTGQGQEYITVALINGDAGVNIVVDDSGPLNVNTPA